MRAQCSASDLVQMEPGSDVLSQLLIALAVGISEARQEELTRPAFLFCSGN